ncbi:hypothetical protein OUZ56_014278 [Daphnia magna]|uniref:Secreted protein n=1 Tax=Daphnia magna TaxID=35525 RepID=A0ABR0AJA9_9CRUS|nr:hypothetical protein OUZ56_014278 [Daphnia magna]
MIVTVIMRFLAAGDGPLSFTRFLEPFLCFFFALELRSFTHRFQQHRVQWCPVDDTSPIVMGLGTRRDP